MRKFLFVLTLFVYGTSLRSADVKVAERGADVFRKRCSGCHSLDVAKEGPPLRGVFRRRSGADPAFPYSEVLKNAGVVWDEENLNRWLADPEEMLPDNDMAFRLANAGERAAIIEYLKQLSEMQDGKR